MTKKKKEGGTFDHGFTTNSDAAKNNPIDTVSLF